MIIMMDNGTSRCMARDNVKSAYRGVSNSCDCYTITITSQINNPGLTQRSEGDGTSFLECNVTPSKINNLQYLNLPKKGKNRAQQNHKRIIERGVTKV